MASILAENDRQVRSRSLEQVQMGQKFQASFGFLTSAHVIASGRVDEQVRSGTVVMI
jgi:hypothetical protein